MDSLSLPLGAWLAIIASGVSVGAILIKFGEMKEQAKTLKETTETRLKTIEDGVAKELQEIKRQLREILDFIHNSQQQRVEDAGWQERTTASITAVAKDALEALELAKISLESPRHHGGER